ncbi:cobalt transporter CbiM [Deferribacter autotrophicus]|uniref:Cobalt transporter CbiM n=1 Tax=Deferribacter autotrophicus TaxID=500465 RepID=A0A5A8F644_9BACT|nr:cobalt transporter CbiM [Deferribacter autotrophicus]KAA0258620.1 cobalt transporter CbiM [Deferribacter autotrophicus]
MHIADGILNVKVVIGADIVAAAPLIYSIYKLSYKELPKTALMSTLFFVASFIHVPFGPTSIHLILNGILGIILGIHSISAIFVALLLQFLLFGYGGLTTLGLNTLNMFAGAMVANYIYKGTKISAFLSGFLAVFISAIFLSLSLALSGKKFIEVAYASFFAHLPLMIIEGIVTMFIVEYLNKLWGEVK